MKRKKEATDKAKQISTKQSLQEAKDEERLCTSSKRASLLILNIFFGGGEGRYFMGNSFFSWKKIQKQGE